MIRAKKQSRYLCPQGRDWTSREHGHEVQKLTDNRFWINDSTHHCMTNKNQNNKPFSDRLIHSWRSQPKLGLNSLSQFISGLGGNQEKRSKIIGMKRYLHDYKQNSFIHTASTLHCKGHYIVRAIPKKRPLSTCTSHNNYTQELRVSGESLTVHDDTCKYWVGYNKINRFQPPQLIQWGKSFLVRCLRKTN